MLKIATFNILDNKNISYNLKCENISPDENKYDNLYHYSVIAKLLTDNDFDVIFLQEVGNYFYENVNDVNNLKNKYIFVQNNGLHLLTLLKINMFENIITKNTIVISQRQIVNFKGLAFTAKIKDFNFNLMLINVHFSSTELLKCEAFLRSLRIH